MHSDVRDPIRNSKHAEYLENPELYRKKNIYDIFYMSFRFLPSLGINPG
jgi:hypothetical protein